MPSHKDTDMLAARWTPEALAAADRAFAKMDPVAAYQGRPPPFPCVSPFGEFEGRQDFRGLPMGSIPAYRTIEHADLSHATDARRGQLSPATFLDCCFDRCAMETNLGTKLHNCTFVRAKLTHTTLRGQFADCDFSHCNLTSSHGAEATFIRCNFSGARFLGSTWIRNVFDQCVWRGAAIGNASFAHATFIGTRPTQEMLGQALVGGIVYTP